MTSKDRGLRLIAVHAHPDDESSKGAATYAYYLDQGVQVMIVSCTEVSAAMCSMSSCRGIRGAVAISRGCVETKWRTHSG